MKYLRLCIRMDDQVENRDCIPLTNTDDLKQDQESQDEVKAAIKQVERWVRKRGDPNSKERKSGFLNFSTQAEIDPDQKPGEGRKIRPQTSHSDRFCLRPKQVRDLVDPHSFDDEI